MAYKLRLPPPAKIHNVFHISHLKKYKGKDDKKHSDLPISWEVQMKEPDAILERRMIRKGNRAVTQLLIKWKENKSKATWKNAKMIKVKFLSFDLATKVTLKGGGLSGSSLRGPSIPD